MDQTSEAEKVNQKKKYEEILTILISAGYHRARINTLSEFDKVVGGLCWCIQSSGEDVDVDILFQENSTIGQRIALSEAIVEAMRKMRCPHPLQAHQIQVISWLIMKSKQYREKWEAQLRNFSVMQFSKDYKIPKEANAGIVSSDLKTLMERNKPKRLYKRRPLKDASEETRIMACLLEFGESYIIEGKRGDRKAKARSMSTAEAGFDYDIVQDQDSDLIRITISTPTTALALSSLEAESSSKPTAGSRSGNADANDFEKKLAQAAKDAFKEEQKHNEQTLEQQKQLKSQMSQLGEADMSGILTGSQVGAIVNIGASDIGSANASYQQEISSQKLQFETNINQGKLGSVAAYKRQRQALVKQREDFEDKILSLRSSVATLQAEMTQNSEETTSAVEYNKKLSSQLLKLNDLESKATQQEELSSLKKLITLSETLEAEEASFKASCKSQLAELESQLEALENNQDGDEEEQRLKEIEDMHKTMSKKYERGRQILAEKNLQAADASRYIDDIPTRTELIQYERRFAELYQQVQWKLDETRKYYALYNTLESKLSFLQKEVKLLNSISENFNEAMKSPLAKTEYLQQFELIVKSVEDSSANQQTILKVKEQKVEGLQSIHQKLIDEQRKYFKAVKDFQDECNKNEWLMAKLEQLQQSS